MTEGFYYETYRFNQYAAHNIFIDDRDRFEKSRYDHSGNFK